MVSVSHSGPARHTSARSGGLARRPGPGAASRELAGRDRELAELAGAWAKAAAGEPGVVLIVGEAGIGKTRLAEALAAEAASAGAMVLPARCYERRGRPGRPGRPHPAADPRPRPSPLL